METTIVAPRKQTPIWLVAMVGFMVAVGVVAGYVVITQLSRREPVTGQTAKGLEMQRQFVSPTSLLPNSSPGPLESSGFKQALDEPDQVVTQDYVKLGKRVINLVASSGNSGSGSAIWTVAADYETYFVKTALPNLGEGKFYQVWLTHPRVRPLPVSRLDVGITGEYVAIFGFDLNPGIQYLVDKFYQGVVISVETVDDEIMENKILEGDLFEND